MKRNLYIGLIFVIILVLASFSYISLAQDERPPEREHTRPQGGEPVEIYTAADKISDLPPNGVEATLPRTRGNALSPSVSLGQPGTSYRYVQTFGISEEGYLTDGDHLNAPSGMFIDGSGNVYVVEDHGYRLLRYNSSGVNTLELGVASFCEDGNDPASFCIPRDVAVDSGGNIWVATGHRIVKFDSSGDYVTQLPVPDSNGDWWDGDDDTHFRKVFGVAIDNANNRLFVADQNNHRVQVYDISSGSPVYEDTIGETGESGDDNSHFNRPRRLAVDSAGRVYVIDFNNRRVQRCNYSSSWGCATFGSGAGSMRPYGIFVDSSNWVYILDPENLRIVKCSSSNVCSDLITDMTWSEDIAVDSSGNIYAGAYGHGVIQKYNSSGDYINDFVGEWHDSYFTDGDHIFSPWGVAVDADGSLYVAESLGYRFLKFDASGNKQWAIGDPGGWGDEDDQFNTLEGKPAIASNGKIYVPDSGNGRIQIFTTAGVYDGTFGSYGSGNDEFAWPMGIAISPVNGNIFIADNDNHRVQVYDSSFNYYTTLGVTEESGSDAAHFDWPYDVAVDKNNNIFVADYNNYRVQKCTLSGTSYTCTTFVGETGVIDDDADFGHLSPSAVAVDNAGRVFVADDWNNRIQVYDSNGSFLTTIGGNWGSRSGAFRFVVGVVTDDAGNVYVSDFHNNRVQKFAPGVPGWLQKNINGFGSIENSGIMSLAPFNGALYAATYNDYGNGGQVWRMTGAGSWQAVITDTLGASQVGDDMIEFKGKLYLSTGYIEGNGGKILRSNTGLDWTPVIDPGFGDLTNGEVYHMEIFSDTLFASTWSYTSTHGTEIWSSSSGDYGDWIKVASNGFDSDTDNQVVLSMEVFNNDFYCGSYNSITGGEVWRTSEGENWEQVGFAGFGDAGNAGISALATFNGYLYAATAHVAGSGVEVWRCLICDNSDWSRVAYNGFGNSDTRANPGMEAFTGYLYLVVGQPNNISDGLQVWRTKDGENWGQVGFSGFGDSLNYATYRDNSISVYENHLFIGGFNWSQGGEVWMYLHNQIYLPIVIR